MYNKKKAILKSSNLDLNTVIEGEDIYNSKFVYMLRKLPSRGKYEVNLAKHRIDLIATEIYGDPNMAEIILLYNGMTIDQLKPGVALESPYPSDVYALASQLTTIKSPREYTKKLDRE